MTGKSVFEPGEKTHRDENFPVASHLIAKRHRGVILAFYRFARAADDVADNPALSQAEKIDTLDRFEDTLLGRSDEIAEALALRAETEQRGLTPRHAQDLLVAFRLDAGKLRYEDWDDLMRYCAYSAMPVGRFVLDVHGESRASWQPNDALCAALQVINHLQDCAADYKRLNRVYLPRAILEKHGAKVEDLAAPVASPALRACLREMAERTRDLLKEAKLSAVVADFRLRLEVAVIERLARKLVGLLLVRDPLSENVHLGKGAVGFSVLQAVVATTARHLLGARGKPALAGRK